ncbi:unnamed protein product, partial [Closterium sp. NIES-53]
PTDSSARSCPKRPCAVRPCSHSVALPCSYSHCLPPARRALLQPARRTLLPSASRPTAASAWCSAAPRVAPCSSQHVAPYCSQRVALCCPTRRALLPCTARALLPCPLRALPCSRWRALLGRAAPPSLSRPVQPELPCPTQAEPPYLDHQPHRAALCCRDSTSPRSLQTCQVFVAASKSSPASAPCLCRPLTHETLLWHHRLGHPSLPPLRGMASRTLVSGLPRCLPPLPPGPAPTCVPCVEGQQRAAPHSSSFPPTEAPLQTLHMDVWGPARVRGQGHEHYFLLVVEDYSRYTSFFPLHNKDRGGEFSSDLLRAFSRAEGIRQTFTLPASPQQNGIAERRIGMVMDVARTSMIHAAAPHFLWPFAVQYAAHQINLQPRVSLPETTPTLRWTGKVGDASAFRVLGSRAFVRDTSADKLSSRAVPCVFHGFPIDAPGWQFYHPTSRRVLSSQDVTFDESVSYYHLFPYRAASPPPRHSS